jgi:hypothetical protein
LLVYMTGVVALVLSHKTAYGAEVDLTQEIAKLQAQADQLSKEIEPLKSEVYLLSKQVRPSPPSFHIDAGAIQVSQLTTAWTNRPSASAVGGNGFAPIITFDLKNIGTKPVTDIYLIVSFYKPDKEVIGGAIVGLLDSSEAPLSTGMWQKVTIDYHLIQFPDTRSVIALNADLYLQTDPDPNSYVLIDTCKISPSVEP